MMRLGIRVSSDVPLSRLEFARQLGLRHVVLNGTAWKRPSDWSVLSLTRAMDACVEHSLRISAVDGMPVGLYNKAMLGITGWEQQLDEFCAIIENVGIAGIPLLVYGWSPFGIWRTSIAAKSDTGAVVPAFSRKSTRSVPNFFHRRYEDSELWEQYNLFVERVVPVAEAAGVSLAVHPSDPPVDEIGGIPLILRSRVALERAMSLSSSPFHGMVMCHGCWSAMGEDPVAAIHKFCEEDRIKIVHLRSVVGTTDEFQECFLHEGMVDVSQVMCAYNDTSCDAIVLPDHVPKLRDVADGTEKAEAYTLGFINQALLYSSRAPTV